MNNKRRVVSRVLHRLAHIVPRRVMQMIPFHIKEKLLMKYTTRDFSIDIVGSCNLACPSCPAGDGVVRDGKFDKNPGGRMSLEMYDSITKRIGSEFPGAIVQLFTWTDPLIHPEVHQFVETTHRYGLKSFLSTNLNILRDAELLARSAPEEIRISLSGFTQDVYSIGHKQGRIEVVKDNMRKLSEALREANVPQENVTVYFHKYVYNLHEVPLMRDYAQSLGFRFDSCWAFYMPIEKVITYLEGKAPREETEFIESRLVLNLKKAVDICKGEELVNVPCRLKTRTVIDCRGNVQLCCNVYSQERFTVASFLETPTKEIEKSILNHKYCGTCASNGLHVYSDWYGHEIRPQIEAMVKQELISKGLDTIAAPKEGTTHGAQGTTDSAERKGHRHRAGAGDGDGGSGLEHAHRADPSADSGGA